MSNYVPIALYPYDSEFNIFFYSKYLYWFSDCACAVPSVHIAIFIFDNEFIIRGSKNSWENILRTISQF